MTSPDGWQKVPFEGGIAWEKKVEGYLLVAVRVTRIPVGLYFRPYANGWGVLILHESAAG